MTATTTNATTTRNSTPLSRTRALATAEFRQLLRNRTLLFNATVPILLPMLVVVLGRDLPGGGAALVGQAFEFLLLLSLCFVQFYTVLSMSVTRRCEGVLRRLRTGESRDAEILAAIAAPGAAATLVFGVLICVAGGIIAGAAPANPALLAAALVAGVVVAAGLGFATGAVTRNAESAQLTALPVLVLASASMTAVRDALRQVAPDVVVRVLDANPFAVVYDLGHAGWTGGGDALRLLGLAAVWAAVCGWYGVRNVKWDRR
ncbi:ABC transporter permease [Corynebacterium sp. 335C]